jgi:peptidoglycan biosynthesis protein MviN/MurJ (putative lipid II flippase)
MFVFAQAIVELFYKTKNFTPEAINSAAKFLQLLSVTIFSIGVNAMVSRIFIAAQKIKQAFAYQLLMNGLLITAIWILSKYYGAYGYPYGVIFINSINFAAMYFICKKFFAQLQYSYLLQYATAIILIHLLITVLLFYTLASADLFYFYKLLLGFCIYLLAVIVMSRIKKISV